MVRFDVGRDHNGGSGCVVTICIAGRLTRGSFNDWD